MGQPAAISTACEDAMIPVPVRTDGLPLAQSAMAGLPALVVDADGDLKFSTPQASALKDGDGLKPIVRQHVAATLADGHAQLVRVDIDDNGEPRRFDLTLMPSVNGEVLIIARETSFEANLITALTNSRELFRDLAACNVDFAFETDEDGIFTWVSPRGALGFSAAEIGGTHPTTVFGEVAGVELFAAVEAVENVEVWLLGKDGQRHCLLITAIPVKGANGTHRATRGVARDVTVLRTHERQAWRSKRRDDLAAAIIEAMRAEIDPQRMLNVTAAALCRATKSDAVSIVCHNGPLRADAGAAPGESALKLHANSIYHGAYNGTITLFRDAGVDPFGDEERQLLAAVMPQLGVAIALGESMVERGAAPRAGEVSC
ncbi:MAG: PAS domain S-box protein [Alphaproteobacteria bacterium]|nr:PAS domain S-box protein [Alphaproteobacteria bacterium]